ncbi:hypothetical protein D3C72_2051110 [compost metagenome]
MRRLAVVTASMRVCPVRTEARAGGMPENAMSTWPPERSVMACELPLYGTCSMSTLACCANRAPARCSVEPCPLEP